MIKPLNLAQKTIKFKSNPEEKKKHQGETRILPNTLHTRMKQGFQKTSSAFLDYPVKGLKGDINSNFYEFLTMGIVPYLIGSGMFMFSFNAVNKFLDANSRAKASKFGNKMALGVVLYGVMKSLSKYLVTVPVKMSTGVDIEMPYENIVYPLPKKAGEAANLEVQVQQRKIFDSKEFYRKDLLKREYYDKVASKLGMGDNLTDSISETSPIIQNIVATAGTAKSISSYCWAGFGVGLAMQDSWDNFFTAIKNRKQFRSNGMTGIKLFKDKTLHNLKNFGKISKAFKDSFVEACGSMWEGNPCYEGFMKHCGKGYILTAAALTALLTANSISNAKNKAKNKNLKTINENKESTVI